MPLLLTDCGTEGGGIGGTGGRRKLIRSIQLRPGGVTNDTNFLQRFSCYVYVLHWQLVCAAMPTKWRF